MDSIRLVQSAWGELCTHAVGPLMLYGIRFEIVSVTSRQELLDICQEALSGEKPTIVLFGAGFVNQFGADLPAAVPLETSALRIIWINVPPPNERAARFRATHDDAIGPMVLEAAGKSTITLYEIEAAINSTLQPRFDEAIRSGPEYYCYDPETDLELHLPMTEVREHFQTGDLCDWLRSLVRESDEDFE